MNNFLGAVLVPTLGNERYLKTCIHSILGDRDARSLRIYLVQNGGHRVSEPTLSLLRPSDVVLNGSQINSITSSLNLGASAVEEELIFRMDDDDLWLNGRFREQYSRFEGGVDLILGRAMFRTANNLRIPQGRITNFEEFSPSLLHLGNYIVHPSVAIKRELVLNMKYRDTVSEDYDLWLRIFQNKLIWKMSSKVISYTSRRNSISSQVVNSDQYTLVYDSFTKYSAFAGLPKISLGSFLLLTGQGGASNLDSRVESCASDLIEYVIQVQNLVAFSEPRYRRIFYDHMLTIMLRNFKYFTPITTQLGWHSAYISGLTRRGYRELLK